MSVVPLGAGLGLVLDLVNVSIRFGVLRVLTFLRVRLFFVVRRLVPGLFTSCGGRQRSSFLEVARVTLELVRMVDVMSRFEGVNRRALVFLGGCAVAVGVAFLAGQSASAAPTVNNCQSAAAPKVNWSGCSVNVDLSSLDMSNGKFIGTKWGESRISDTNLRGADFTRSEFSGKGAWKSILSGLEGTQFHYDDFANANFAQTSGKVNVAYSKFDGANMQDADMSQWALVRGGGFGGWCFGNWVDDYTGKVDGFGIVKGTPKVLPQNPSPFLPWFFVNGEFTYNNGSFPECPRRTG